MKTINMSNENFMDIYTFVGYMSKLAMDCLNVKNVPYVISYDLEEHVWGSTTADEDGVRCVLINVNQTMDQMINTIFHETRHVYQYQTYKRYMSWRFKRVIKRTKPRSFLQYYFQPIEIGARLYAYYAMKKYKRQINNLVQAYKDKVLTFELY